jgi:DNA mismatch endonuclease (patch repair protein)
MRGNRSRNTRPESRLRSLLHREGFRFRKDHLIRVGANEGASGPSLPAPRVAVFVDGCFWNGCPQHGNSPRANADYWRKKLARNVSRDKAQLEALRANGWLVIRVWEHVAADEAARQVAGVLRRDG